MPVARGIVAGVIGTALMMAVIACGPAVADEQAALTARQMQTTASNTPVSQQDGTTVWGKVPYCTCLTGVATANVASALKAAELTVSLKELSPYEGWLYFVATFDSASATLDQVSAAIEAGGGEVVAGPP